MDKKITLIITVVVIAIIGFGIYRNRTTQSNNQVLGEGNSSKKASHVSPSPTPQPADKIVIVHFHGTNQCWSCITVGEYALKTIKEEFPEEYASGKIIYKDINGELKENQEIVAKYRARGSSLFINAIRNGQDNISEDVKVWRLVNNEAQFIDYFEARLRSLLGK